MNTDRSLEEHAAKAGMHEQTARKYINAGDLPSQLKQEHNWRTRKDPFADDWDSKIKPFLETNSGLEAKTLFEYLQRETPGKYQDGQLRTLQRRVKTWRATEGPPQEVMFPQVHYPGILCQSDFTHMTKLGITIGGESFSHMIYHFVLTYSNWEAGTICNSESFESLSVGLQNALWTLGAVPQIHQTDRLTAAVHKTSHPDEFTRSYTDLLDHYRLEGRKIQVNSPNENGDVEQRHHRFKRAVDQRLMLRGSRDFDTVDEYKQFLKNLFRELNMGRQNKLEEELQVMRDLPAAGRLEAFKTFTVPVTRNSTITVQHNIYSVPSKLIGERVKVYVHADYLDVRYAQRSIEKIPRLRGEGKHEIKYYHVIDSLIKKPGAFENYKYQEHMFPTTYFRVTYDTLLKQRSHKAAVKEYLKILYMAAYDGESHVEQALKKCLDSEAAINAGDIKDIIKFQKHDSKQAKTHINIKSANLKPYDRLLDSEESKS